MLSKLALIVSAGRYVPASMSSPNSARIAAAYSARLSRWNVRCPGLVAAAASSVVSSAVTSAMTRGGVGLARRLSRRHHAGAQLADHLFGDVRLIRGLRDIECGQRQLAALHLVVVTADAVGPNRVVGRRGDRLRSGGSGQDGPVLRLGPGLKGRCTRKADTQGDCRPAQSDYRNREPFHGTFSKFSRLSPYTWPGRLSTRTTRSRVREAEGRRHNAGNPGQAQIQRLELLSSAGSYKPAQPDTEGLQVGNRLDHSIKHFGRRHV